MIESKPGIYENVSFEDYLAVPAFHKSMVAPALRSTIHLHHYITTEQKTSTFMDFGSLLDCLLLENEIFDSQFIMIPDMGEDSKGNPKPWSNQLKYCKAWTQEQRDLGLTPYSDLDYNKACAIIKNIKEHKTAGPWMEGGKNQVAIVWEDKETGLLCKGRIDKLHPDSLVDLKSTVNASPSEFKRTINNFLYHVQAAMYSWGWAQLNGGEYLPFNLAVAESEAPYCVAAYRIGDESIAMGESLFKRAIHKYKDYLESGPTGYSQFPEDIEIPQWAFYADEDFDESLLEDTK